MLAYDDISSVEPTVRAPIFKHKLSADLPLYEVQHDPCQPICMLTVQTLACMAVWHGHQVLAGMHLRAPHLYREPDDKEGTATQNYRDACLQGSPCRVEAC